MGAKLYDEDFALWATETARLLRDGRLDEIDVENLAEEVEDLARRDRREMASRIAVILRHLLKWRSQPGKRSGSWQPTIITQRAELDGLFEQSPSLRQDVPAAVARGYSKAAAAAGADIGVPVETFPRDCPYSPEQILDESFLPAR